MEGVAEEPSGIAVVGVGIEGWGVGEVATDSVAIVLRGTTVGGTVET